MGHFVNAGFIQDQQDAFLLFGSSLYTLRECATIPPGYVPVPVAVIDNLYPGHSMFEFKEDE